MKPPLELSNPDGTLRVFVKKPKRLTLEVIAYDETVIVHLNDASAVAVRDAINEWLTQQENQNG